MTDPIPRPHRRERESDRAPGLDAVDLEPRERALLEEAVRPVAQRGRGPTLTIALVIAAFALGLVRPWDWLAGTPSGTNPPAGEMAAAPTSPTAGVEAPRATLLPTPTPPPGSEAAAAATCAYPLGWRSATLQDYAGRRALVWTAIDAVKAIGPLDPAIRFEGIAGDTFTAIGWCAPVDGPDRPPLDTAGRLYRIEAGSAVPEPYVRLHPAASNAFGELWGPVGPAPGASPEPSADATAAAPVASPADSTGSAPVDVLETGASGPTWAPGRYVIELADPARSFVRWLGLDIRLSPHVLAPASGPGSSAGADASGSPVGSAAASAVVP